MSAPRREQHILYHGTSAETAELIKREGFKPSTSGCLGPGVYVARADKASRFAADSARHGGVSGAVLKLRITFWNAKYVRSDDVSWQSQGFDACRADTTTRSGQPEWCLKDPRQVEVIDVRQIAPGERLPAFEVEMLSLAAVRNAAGADGLKEIYHKMEDGVVSFVADSETPDSPRVDVYYSTGTAVVRPKKGSNRRYVLRAVEIRNLQDVFREIASRSDNHQSPKRPRPSSSRWVNTHGPAEPEEAAVSAVLEVLRRDAAEAMRKVHAAEGVLNDAQRRRDEVARREAEARRLEEEKKRQEEAERQRQEEERQRQAALAQAQAAKAEEEHQRSFRGTSCTFVIMNDSASAELKKRSDSGSLKTVTHLTLVGSGFFLARENGDSFWSCIPHALSERLVDDGLNVKGKVAYMAAGPNGQYFANVGHATWWSGNSSDRFQKAVRSSKTVEKVAFGANWSYFVLYTDGSCAWQGIPTPLANKINGRFSNKRMALPARQVAEISLGSAEGQFYVKFKDGTYDYVLPTGCATAYRNWEDAGWTVRNVALNSANGEWAIRYS